MGGIKTVFQILIFFLFCFSFHFAYAETGKSLEKIRPFGFTQLWAQYDNTRGANHGEAHILQGQGLALRVICLKIQIICY